jgi:hypothetical protein
VLVVVLEGPPNMKARKLIEGAAYGPEALKVIGQAFDEAWEAIAGNFSSDPNVVGAARMNLAKAVLSVADDDSRDVSALKRAALDIIKRKFRFRIG